jgi:hypothetical protein
VSRRLVIAGVAAAAVAGAVVPAFASTGTQPAATGSPVTVYTDTHDGVAAGFYVNGQPGAGASVTPEGKACVGISLQLPVCADAGPVGAIIDPPGTTTRQKLPSLPVTVTHDTSNGVSVGTAVGSQPLVGARVSGGEACVGFSYEIPFCAGGPIEVDGAQSRQALPAGIYRDQYGTTVWAEDIGVRVNNDGRVCPQVSTQLWPCVGGDS